MGEAKQRRSQPTELVWHHTSILRTNRMWMSGVVELEGRSPGVEHPAFGDVHTSAKLRRDLVDFPALAWFTTQIDVPACLQHFDVYGRDRQTGEAKALELGPDSVAAFTMNRVAIGFPIASTPVQPWSKHFGYKTREGRELNASAKDVGDNPDDWWVADQPVDLMLSTAFRSAKSLFSPKLERQDGYVADIHRMVSLCRAIPGTFIPPSWVGTPAHQALIKSGGDVTKWGKLAAAIAAK